MNIHLFNPEHDIALAANNKFWTAPHAGRQLRADLGWLPVLWSDEGDIVIVNDIAHAQNAVRKLNRKLPEVSFVTLSTLQRLLPSDVSGVCVLPWGWDISVVHQLRKAGVPRTLLPTEPKLARLREISDRATSSRLLKEICMNIPGCVGESRIVTDVAEIAVIEKDWNRIVLKSPWSSSGRGVRYIDDRPHNIIMWAEKVIKSQGHLMVERCMDKVTDFGMEFQANNDGSVEYLGLSLFDTTSGAYTGSILATEEEKLDVITRFISPDLLNDIKEYVCRWMQNELKGIYTGPFGVDMMICKTEDGTLAVDPCVEINLRRTMGHVALAVSPKEKDLQQIMRIGYEESSYHFRIYNDHEILF